MLAEASSFSWFDGLALLVVPLLILLNGFFVAGEFALVSIRHTEVEQLLQKGTRRAKSLHRQFESLDDAIAACQLGITVASLLLGWLGEQTLAHLFHPVFSFLSGPWQVAAAHTAASLLAIVIITVLHVVLGEQAPKLFALQQPDRVALWIALPLEYFTKATKPLVYLMNAMSNGVTRLFGLPPSDGENRTHTVAELSMLVEEVEEAGLITSEQAEYVHNVFLFSAKKVGECMLPREKMSCLELHMPLNQVLDMVRESAHTRIPVYDMHLDNIVGIVNTKDLLHLVSMAGMAILDDAIYPASFMSPEQSIAEALRHFKKTKRHMAIVRNEQHEVVGLITLEDILEELIGDIEDEHDTPKAQRRFKLSRAAWTIGKKSPSVGKGGLSQQPPTKGKAGPPLPPGERG
ncbi:MAG: hemolysin family protein [Gemmatales bacterium]